MTHNITLILSAILLFTACGGGNSTTGQSAGPTDLISLSSIDEGGSSSAFAARSISSTAPTNGIGIVLLHGRNGNSDSTVVSELRKDLAQRNYPTLSITEAVPSGYTEGGGVPFQAYIDDINGANTVFPETYARIRTAINTLKDQNVSKVVILGFSLGSRMASAHIPNGQRNELPIIGFIGIGMYGTSINPLNITNTLSSISIPVLDIYGNLDINAVNTATARKSAYNGLTSDYNQTILTCAAGLASYQCHSLPNLKGSASAPLETLVAKWISLLP